MSNLSSHTDEWTPTPLDIPPHWEQIDFEDAFENISLSHLKIPQKEYLSSGTIPIVDQGVNLIGGFTNDATRSIQPNRALIVFGDHTKCFKLVGFRFAPGADGVKVLRPISINERFAYYACRALRLPDRGYSRHYAFLKKSKLPLAPQNEQHRIVAKIEELFSELDKGIESLKTAWAKLNIYRQAVLKNAFEGKLTAQWREENKDKLETPEQLLARIKQEREARYDQQLQEWKAAVKEWEEGGKTAKKPAKPKAPKSLTLLTAEELAALPKLPEGWSWTRFGLLDIELKRGPFGSSITKSMFVQSGFKVYEQGNAIYRDTSRGSYFINDEKYKELSGFIVLPGDFIVSCAGTVGRIFLLPENAMAGVINQALMRVRINDTILSKRFFEKLFESAFFQRKVLSDAKGTAMVNLAGIKELNLVPVAICNMSEQKIIDELLDSRLSEIDQCERTIATALQQADALRQSILKKAFSGQLVPQDPDDEPASILLERIKAEKAARSQNNTRAKRRPTKATA